MNPESNIVGYISDEFRNFTVSEQKIAEYILNNKTDVQYMSISDLAAECGVAEATISRFCRRLNLKGYNDFKLAIAKAVAFPSKNGKDASPTADTMSDIITADDGVEELCHKLYVAHASTLAQTASLIRPEAVRNAAELLYRAERVYCMGQGGSMVIAREAAQLFSTISNHFFPIADSHTQTGYVAMMSPKDAVLFFSYSGSTKDIEDIFSLIHRQGAKVVLVTRFLRSPGARMADVILQCGSNEGPFQLGSTSAKLAQLFIIDIIYNEICRLDPATARKNQELIASALADKHL